MEEGRWSAEELNFALMTSLVREGGRKSTFLTNVQPRERKTRLGGRWLTSWLNMNPSVRWVREGGRLSTGWSNELPKTKWVMEGGRSPSGELKSCRNFTERGEEGREALEWTTTVCGECATIFCPSGTL